MSLKKPCRIWKKKKINIKAENIMIALKSKSLRKSWKKKQTMTVIMKVLGWIEYIPALTATSSLESKSVLRIV